MEKAEGWNRGTSLRSYNCGRRCFLEQYGAMDGTDLDRCLGGRGPTQWQDIGFFKPQRPKQ